MAKRIVIDIFSPNSIKDARKEVKRYQKSLTKKCNKFVKRLIETGISVAKTEVGNFGKYIVFTSEVSQMEYGCKGIMVATNTGLIKSQWQVLNASGGYDVKEADVSPVLMAEFGAGLPAQRNPDGPKFGMGTGTFPGQTHAEDPEGWWYMDLSGEWHHSYGITPTMPMARAFIEMLGHIDEIAKEVFRS